MQYQYTNESTVEVRISMTYADIKLIKRLLTYKAGKDKLDWRDTELLEQVDKALHDAAVALRDHYNYELEYTLKQEETDK